MDEAAPVNMILPYNRHINNQTGVQTMARKQPTTFAGTRSTHLEDDAIFTIGDCCVCLRLSEREEPIEGVRHSHDYCDANMTMDAAMASVGIVALPEDEDGMPDAVVGLWNTAWDHVKLRMASMPI